MTTLKALLKCASTHNSVTFNGRDKKDFICLLKRFIEWELTEGLKNHETRGLFDDHHFSPELESLIEEAEDLSASGFLENFK